MQIDGNVIGMATIGGSLIAVVTFVLTNSREEAKKRSRIYGRIDELQAENEGKYTRKDVCEAHMAGIFRELKELKENTKEISDFIHNGLRSKKKR
jgi:hypothetical protein